MQNTRRKARSCAETGGSVKCSANTLELTKVGTALVPLPGHLLPASEIPSLYTLQGGSSSRGAHPSPEPYKYCLWMPGKRRTAGFPERTVVTAGCPAVQHLKAFTSGCTRHTQRIKCARGSQKLLTIIYVEFTF